MNSVGGCGLGFIWLRIATSGWLLTLFRVHKVETFVAYLSDLDSQ